MIAFAAVVVLVLFDVDLRPHLSLPRALERPVPDVEAAYRACYESRDREIHGIAFGTIDNPDVQKEYISSNEAVARTECRRRHPEKLVTVQIPFSFNLVDLEPRFW